MVSSHDFLKDKRNKNVKIYVNGKFYHRDKAKISVFDLENSFSNKNTHTIINEWIPKEIKKYLKRFFILIN